MPIVPIKPQSEQLSDIRNSLLNRMMAVCAFLAVPALAASIMRIADVGWRFSMTVQVILFFSLWGAVIMRDALSYRARAAILIFILALLAVSSYLSFGIITGPLWSLVAVVFITLIMGKRVGAWSAAFALLLIAVVYALYMSGIVVYDQDFNQYMRSPLSWANSFASMLLVFGGTVMIVAGLYGALEKALAGTEEEYRGNAAISMELQIKAAEQEHLLAEYRIANAKLRESEEKFRLISDNTSDFIWMMDLNGNLVHAGANSEQFTGYTPEEVKSMPLEARYGAESAAETRAGVAAIKKRVEAGETVPDGSVVVECIKKGGEVAWHEARYHLTVDEDGRTYIIGISRDVTERVRTENEKEEESRLLSALDRVNRSMSQTPDLTELMSAVLGETLDIFGSQRAVLIYPCDPEAPEWTAMMERAAPGYQTVGSLGGNFPMQPQYAGFMRSILASENPVQILRSDTDENQRELDEKLTIKSRLSFAVKPRSGKPWIFSLHQCTHERVWTEFEKELFKQIASRLADGLSMALIFGDLKSSEERFRSLVTSMADWAWECDKDGAFTYASEKVTSILGYKPEEVVGKKFTHFLMPGEVDRVTKAVADSAKLRQPIKNLENWNRTKEGKPVCIITNGMPLFDTDGRLTGYRGVDIDITERKLNEQALSSSERKFRELFQSASVGILLANSRNQIIDANAEALRILGYTLAEIRKIDSDSLADPDEPQARPLLTLDADAGVEASRQHRRFLRRNGSSVHVLVSVSSSSDGVFIVMFHDLTSQRKTEQQLFQAQKLEAVGALADGIALDFNNILHAIVGFSSLLKADSALPEKSRAYVDNIEQSAERGAALVKGMMAFSSSGSGDMAVQNMSEVLDRAIGFMSSTFPRNIEIKAALNHGAARVEADASQIEQVILNLGTNARDAMESGGVLSISTGVLDIGQDGSPDWVGAPPGEYMFIVVADSGPGIPPEVAAHIFEPFFSTKEEGKGSGLGLSTAYGIVRNHKGFVNFDSSPGRTAFSILLPIKDKLAEQTEEDTDTGGKVKEAPTDAGVVLVVDDEAYVREIAEEGLRSDGYRVIAVASGEEAVEVVRKGEVDITTVVLDLGMPGMSGEKCLELLLDANPSLRVIVASGYGVSDVIEQLLASGAAAFLKKPYRIQALADLVAGKSGRKVVLPIAVT